MTSERRPLLAVTMGDPAGIGPEVVVKALSVPAVRDAADIVVYGDAAALDIAAGEAAISGRAHVVSGPEEARKHASHEVFPVVAVSSLAPDALRHATPSPEGDRAQVAYVQRAAEDARGRRVGGIVTAPINKEAIARAGAPWPGHTEMLASLCGAAAADPIMMIVSERLRVVPLTIHVALKEVPALITPERLTRALREVSSALLRFFGLGHPRIAVCGLNPHAGEHGLFGDEEAKRIVPGIEAAQAEGIAASGPFPADSIFRRAVEGEFDAVIGMYHDQALIPVKLLDFDNAVNVTLGLPIIRTSVDHGTAYDIAGKGVASAGSLISALRLAATMAAASRGR